VFGIDHRILHLAHFLLHRTAALTDAQLFLASGSALCSLL
jgi:hypothetical protein